MRYLIWLVIFLVIEQVVAPPAKTPECPEWSNNTTCTANCDVDIDMDEFNNYETSLSPQYFFSGTHNSHKEWCALFTEGYMITSLVAKQADKDCIENFQFTFTNVDTGDTKTQTFLDEVSNPAKISSATFSTVIRGYYLCRQTVSPYRVLAMYFLLRDLDETMVSVSMDTATSGVCQNPAISDMVSFLDYNVVGWYADVSDHPNFVEEFYDIKPVYDQKSDLCDFALFQPAPISNPLLTMYVPVNTSGTQSKRIRLYIYGKNCASGLTTVAISPSGMGVTAVQDSADAEYVVITATTADSSRHGTTESYNLVMSTQFLSQTASYPFQVTWDVCTPSTPTISKISDNTYNIGDTQKSLGNFDFVFTTDCYYTHVFEIEALDGGDGVVTLSGKTASVQTADASKEGIRRFKIWCYLKNGSTTIASHSFDFEVNILCTVTQLAFVTNLPATQEYTITDPGIVLPIGVTQTPACNAAITYTATVSGTQPAWVTLTSGDSNSDLTIESNTLTHDTAGLQVTLVVTATEAISGVTVTSNVLVRLNHPCRSSVVQVATSFSLDAYVEGLRVSVPLNPTNTVSDSKNDPDYCGAYEITVQNDPFPLSAPKFNINPENTVDFQTNSITDYDGTDMDNPLEIVLQVSLTSYPTATSATTTLTLTVLCEVTQLTFPQSFGNKIFIIDVQDPIEQSVAVQQSPSCGGEVTYSVSPTPDWLSFVNTNTLRIAPTDPALGTEEVVSYVLTASLTTGQGATVTATDSFTIQLFDNPCIGILYTMSSQVSDAHVFSTGRSPLSLDISFSSDVAQLLGNYDCGDVNFAVSCTDSTWSHCPAENPTWVQVSMDEMNIHMDLPIGSLTSLSQGFTFTLDATDFPDIHRQTTFSVFVYDFSCQSEWLLGPASGPEFQIDTTDPEVVTLTITVSPNLPSDDWTESLSVQKSTGSGGSSPGFLTLAGAVQQNDSVLEAEVTVNKAKTGEEGSWDVSVAYEFGIFGDTQPTWVCEFPVEILAAAEIAFQVPVPSEANFFFAEFSQPNSLDFTQGWSFSMPGVEMIEGSNMTDYTIEVVPPDRLSDVLIWTDELLMISEGKIDCTKHAGMNKIEIAVIDENKMRSSAEIHLNISCPNVVANSTSSSATADAAGANLALVFIPKLNFMSKNPPRPYIEKIDSQGKVLINFSRTLILPETSTKGDYLRFALTDETEKTGRNLQQKWQSLVKGYRTHSPIMDYINNGTLYTNLTLFSPVEVYLQRGADSQQNLEFSWMAVSQSSTHLELKLNFQKANAVSMSKEEPDILVVRLIGQSLFVDKDGQFIPPDHIMSRIIPSQINAQTAKNVQSVMATAETATKAAMASNLIVNLLLEGSLNQLLSAISVLQVLVHYTLVNVRVPQSAVFFYSIVLQIASFDVIDTTAFMQEFLELDHSEPFSENFETSGYPSTYFLINIGSLAVYITIMPIYVVFLVLFSMFCCTIKLRQYFQRKLSGMLYNGIIGLFEKSYIIIATCTGISLRRVTQGLHPIDIDFAFTLLGVFIMLAYPLVVTLIVCCNRDRLTEESFKTKFGYLTQNLHVGQRGNSILWHHLSNTFRNILLAYCLTFMDDYPVFQLMALNYMSLYMLIMAGMRMSFLEKSDNHKTINDEYTMFFITYHLICSSDLVQDTERREEIGNSMIVTTLAIIVIQLAGIIYTTIAQMVHKCRGFYYKRRNDAITKKRAIERKLREERAKQDKKPEKVRHSQKGNPQVVFDDEDLSYGSEVFSSNRSGDNNCDSQLRVKSNRGVQEEHDPEDHGEEYYGDEDQGSQEQQANEDGSEVREQDSEGSEEYGSEEEAKEEGDAPQEESKQDQQSEKSLQPPVESEHEPNEQILLMQNLISAKFKRFIVEKRGQSRKKVAATLEENTTKLSLIQESLVGEAQDFKQQPLYGKSADEILDDEQLWESKVEAYPVDDLKDFDGIWNPYKQNLETAKNMEDFNITDDFLFGDRDRTLQEGQSWRTLETNQTLQYESQAYIDLLPNSSLPLSDQMLILPQTPTLVRVQSNTSNQQEAQPSKPCEEPEPAYQVQEAPLPTAKKNTRKIKCPLSNMTINKAHQLNRKFKNIRINRLLIKDSMTELEEMVGPLPQPQSANSLLVDWHKSPSNKGSLHFSRHQMSHLQSNQVLNHAVSQRFDVVQSRNNSIQQMDLQSSDNDFPSNLNIGFSQNSRNAEKGLSITKFSVSGAIVNHERA